MADDQETFSLGNYGELVGRLLAKGYRMTRFHEAESEKRHLILRHDVDMSLDAALAMAAFEAENDISSTYFVLLRTEFYNVLSRRGTDALGRLKSLGHEVGLHFDASAHESGASSLAKAASHECEVLESVLGGEVRTLSLHRPHRDLLDRGFTVPSRINAYEPRFFRDIGYCSDSRGGWHHGHPLDHPAVGDGRALQLLTHPIWWHAYGHESVREKLDRFLLRRFDVLRGELALNCETYPQAFVKLASEDD